MKNRALWLIIGSILLILSVLMILRMVANGGEDTWICDQGQWVKHGSPSRPAPTGSCQNNF